MAAKQFIEIVNDALAEAKVQLDPLTPVNFADPPRTVLYNNFKRWVNVAYKELYNDRPEWHFRQERASFVVYPRLHVVEQALNLTVGMTLRGATSGVAFTVVNVYDFESIEHNAETELTLDVVFIEGTKPANLIFREDLDLVDPNDIDVVLEGTAAYLKGYGRYDFRSNILDLAQININSLRMHRTPDDAIAHNERFGTVARPLEPMLWEAWPMDYDLYPWTGDFPQYVVETPHGTYDLYPRPVTPMYVAFDYARKVVPLVLYSDVPAGLPEEWHDYLVWKAVEEFADFDNNTKLFSRAKKHVEKYYGYLDRDEKQKPRFETSRFYGNHDRRGF